LLGNRLIYEVSTTRRHSG